jgi:phage gp37-like protein
MDVAGAVAEVVELLTAAGIRATGDERDLNPPAVYVAPPGLAWRFRHGDVTADWQVFCAVPNSGRDAALRNLSQLLTATVDALATATGAAVQATPTDLVVPELAAPLPAYLLTWSARITAPRPAPKT